MNGHDHTTSHSHHNHRRHHHNPYYASSSSSPSLKGCCCFLFLLLSLLLLLLLAVTLAILLALKPTKPRFDLQQVSVSSVTVTTPTTTTPSTASLTAAAALLSLSMRMQFLAANPNKVGIRYGESRFTVMYRGVPLGEGRVAGFYQAARSVREVETVVGVERVGVQEGDAAELVRDAEVNDRVELRLLGDVGARVRVLGVDTPAVEGGSVYLNACGCDTTLLVQQKMSGYDTTLSVHRNNSQFPLSPNQTPLRRLSPSQASPYRRAASPSPAAASPGVASPRTSSLQIKHLSAVASLPPKPLRIATPPLPAQLSPPHAPTLSKSNTFPPSPLSLPSLAAAQFLPARLPCLWLVRGYI
ncbi:hypothetical protein Droror1_Dr00024215 [Drosera rotundifolia]